MKTWSVVFLILGLAVGMAFAAQKTPPGVPKYDPTTEAVFKGTVQEITDRQCPVSGGTGAHVLLKLADGSTIEVHLATSKFVKIYDLVINQGDEVEVTGSKVKFEGVDTIFARELKHGNDTYVFRDKDGRPVW